MVTPTKSDIDKRNKKRDDLWKGLNPDGSMTEKQLCTQIRSAIRQVWFAHKTKLSYLYDHTKPDMNPNTKTKWLVQCEMCGEDFKLSDIEINHKKGENQLLTLDDVLPFAKSILGVTHDDIECLCKECHSVLTYSERYGVSLEEAAHQKEVIAKMKQTVAKQKAELKKAGFTNAEISNDKLRRECYSKLLLNK